MLQILPEWSDCRLRATLLTTNILQSAYVCFSGDKTDPKKSTHRFYKYFYEPQAQDHPPLLGGGTQIAVDGAPLVETLEQWDKEKSRWLQIWNRSEGR